ncbi:MAG: sigma-70 family RNA polymerase sigma factor [Anaeromyxobacter sp.]
MSLDRAGVEELYRAHGGVVLRRARMLLGNEADAQEALQEVFAGLLRAPGEIRDPAAVIAWLYRATTHLCLNVLRGRRTSGRLLERHLRALPAAAPSRADALAEVRSVLAGLPAELAAAFVHHHLDGMTYDEIGEQLGCSRRKVGYLLQKAEALLREPGERTA